jgi:hypothetical protein
MNYPLVSCPKCKHLFENAPDQEVLNGRDFLIVFWLHRGFMVKDIVKALGINTATFTKYHKRLGKKYAQKSGFFGCRRRKDGRRKLQWFYRGGIFFEIDQRDEGPERAWDSYFDWRYRDALKEGKKIITDLSDWQASGFVFTDISETRRGEIFAYESSSYWDNP